MPERSVEEISGGKRVLRDYDAITGKLLRIRILPLPRTDAPDPPRRRKRAPAPEPAPPAAPETPTAPEMEIVLEEVRDAPRGPVRARFDDEPARAATTDVIVAPLPAPDPRPALAPLPPAPEPARAPEPEPAPAIPPALPIHARLAGEPPRAGTIDVLLDRVAQEPLPELAPVVITFREPEAPPAPIVIAPEPPPPPEPLPAAPRAFEIIALERVAPPPPASEPEPTPVAREPEPIAAIPSEPEPIAEPPADPAPLQAPPEPDPPRRAPPSYVAIVPDVDARVDALLSREDAPAKRRKRAPIPAPTFAPLARDAWEERLDAALRGR